jgi:hypothetical protein
MSSSTPKKKKYKVIGTRPVRHDGADKVTGRAIYGSDVRLSGLVHGRTLRSPHAHARIKSIDTSAAEKLPGVLAVTTAADFPNLKDKIANLGEGSVNLAHLGANVLAHGKVLYKGTPLPRSQPSPTFMKPPRLIKVDTKFCGHLGADAMRKRPCVRRRAPTAWEVGKTQQHRHAHPFEISNVTTLRSRRRVERDQTARSIRVTSSRTSPPRWNRTDTSPFGPRPGSFTARHKRECCRYPFRTVSRAGSAVGWRQDCRLSQRLPDSQPASAAGLK